MHQHLHILRMKLIYFFLQLFARIHTASRWLPSRNEDPQMMNCCTYQWVTLNCHSRFISLSFSAPFLDSPHPVPREKREERTLSPSPGVKTTGTGLRSVACEQPPWISPGAGAEGWKSEAEVNVSLIRFWGGPSSEMLPSSAYSLS